MEGVHCIEELNENVKGLARTLHGQSDKIVQLEKTLERTRCDVEILSDALSRKNALPNVEVKGAVGCYEVLLDGELVGRLLWNTGGGLSPDHDLESLYEDDEDMEAAIIVGLDKIRRQIAASKESK